MLRVSAIPPSHSPGRGRRRTNLSVELRRTELHHAVSRFRLGLFFFAFGMIETILVLSIDGVPHPFQWFDLVSALLIFSLLSILFVLSLRDLPRGPVADLTASVLGDAGSQSDPINRSKPLCTTAFEQPGFRSKCDRRQPLGLRAPRLFGLPGVGGGAA